MNELILADAKTLMKQIVATKGECVPAIIEDVRDTLLFTRTKANMLREALKGIANIEGAGEMAEALVEQRDEAQGAEFYMTKRLGEITREIEKGKTGPRDDEVLPGKREKLLGRGVSSQVASEAERIAANEWAIEAELEEKSGSTRGPTKAGVLNRIREKESAAHADKQKNRADDRVVREKPRLVAEYLESIKEYRGSLELAIAGAKRDKFDPNAWNFLKLKHEQLRELMAELEATVNGR